MNVCSGRTKWGNIRVDLLEAADIRQDWSNLSFPNDSFGAVFADPPWDSQYKPQVKRYMEKAIRIAPIVYLMAPWIYGSSMFELTNVWIRQLPGINPIVAITRYKRKENYEEFEHAESFVRFIERAGEGRA